MTRVVGYNKVGCPHCGRIYKTNAYGSLNYMDYKRWSDGYAEYRLMPSRSPILQCQCSALFLTDQLVVSDTTVYSQTPEHVAKKPLLPMVGQWIARLLGWCLRKTLNDCLQAREDDADASIYLHSITVPDDQLGALLANPQWGDNHALALAIHLRHWRFLNGSYRAKLVAQGRAAITNGAPAPTMPQYCAELFQPLLAHLQHLQATLRLVIALTPADWLSTMELQRELGWYDAAMQTYQSQLIGKNEVTEPVGATLYDLAKRGINAPALLAYG